MIRPINKDQVSLRQASVPATLNDSNIANDLIDTLKHMTMNVWEWPLT